MADRRHVYVYFTSSSPKKQVLIYNTRAKARPFVCAGCTKGRARRQHIYFLSIFTAISKAIFIMLVKVVCRSSAESSVPLTRLSEMEQMARARLPV